jgi:hypothetical protein
MEIKVRGYIRVLGILLCIVGYFANISQVILDTSLDYSDIFWITFGSFFFLPLVLASSILGHVPYFISNKIPKLLEDPTLNAEKVFKNISFESVFTAIVAFTIFFFAVYFQ